MTNLDRDPRDDAPTVEVRVYLHGELAHRELCESEDEAALVVAMWSEHDGARVEVDDLTVQHRPGQVLEPEPALLDEERELTTDAGPDWVG